LHQGENSDAGQPFCNWSGVISRWQHPLTGTARRNLKGIVGQWPLQRVARIFFKGGLEAMP